MKPKREAADLGGPTGELPLEPSGVIWDEGEAETYVCGNPPYLGSKWQDENQKGDLRVAFSSAPVQWKYLDYVCGWIVKAAKYGLLGNSAFAFVATNSICQGQQVPILWPLIQELGYRLQFAHTSFYWRNLAERNAGVTVVIVGLTRKPTSIRRLYITQSDLKIDSQSVDNINPYLVAGKDAVVQPRRKPLGQLCQMMFGNMPRDGGHLCLSYDEAHEIIEHHPEARIFVRPYIGSAELIQGKPRFCLWITERNIEEALSIHPIRERLEYVTESRSRSSAPSTQAFADQPHRFVQIQGTAENHTIAVAKVSSFNRHYIPADLLSAQSIVSDQVFALYDSSIWQFALISSRMHYIWISAVCGKMKTDLRYSNTIGWNNFPLNNPTQQQISDLELSAKRILEARERYFPLTIADLYDPSRWSEFLELTEAHELNDNIIERMAIGRLCHNDTERLEVLFRKYGDGSK